MKTIDLSHLCFKKSAASELILIGSFSPKEIEKEILTRGKKKEEFAFTNLDFDGVEYFLALKGFRIIPENKRKSKSATSNAIYIAESADKMDGLLLQYLPPQSRTSCHYHKGKTEAYHLVEGTAAILKKFPGRLCNIWHPFDLEAAEPHIVFPFEKHKVETDKFSSLTLLEIIGDPKGLSMDDHHYGE